MGVLGRFLFWDFRRASWQYDVMVALILGFIFITPRDIFRDQPKATSVMMLPSDQGAGLYWIAPPMLAGVAESDRISRAAALVNARYKTRKTVTRVEPILDAEQDITGYMAYTRP